MNLLGETNSGAVFSDCRKYRYKLWRIWDPEKPLVNVIGLNPSTADETVDDPTIRRCLGFAREYGFGGLIMTNIFAYRSTDPRALPRLEDPVGPANNLMIAACAAESEKVIAAWGQSHCSWSDRDKEVLKILRGSFVRPGAIPNTVYCFGTTKRGYPRHPLYLPKTCKARLLHQEGLGRTSNG